MAVQPNHIVGSQARISWQITAFARTSRSRAVHRSQGDRRRKHHGRQYGAIQHPSTHGVLRLVLELDGETIIKATPHIGYLHTGIEKTMENLTYYKALVCTDREDYLSNLINNLAYSLAVEKLIDVTIPRRCAGACALMLDLSWSGSPPTCSGLARTVSISGP